jgi:hypothetical protein
MGTALVIYRKLIAPDGVVSHVREVALVLGSYLLFMSIRKVLIRDIEDIALDNADKVIAFETSNGFFWEPQLQERALEGGKWMMLAFNWIYIVTFVPSY